MGGGNARDWTLWTGEWGWGLDGWMDRKSENGGDAAAVVLSQDSTCELGKCCSSYFCYHWKPDPVYAVQSLRKVD